MTGEDCFANVPAQLDELLERGAISHDGFALYTPMSARLVAACRGAKKNQLCKSPTIGTKHEECAEVRQ